jgi:hypothetical protein
MKVVLISMAVLSENEIALPVSKGQLARKARLPSHLPEHPSAGIGTLDYFSSFRVDTTPVIQVVEASQGRSLRLSG